MAAGQGFKTFTTGEVLTAADTNGYLMQGVLVFADAAARSAAITSPQEGQMSYLKDTNATEYYSGSAWTTVGAAGGGMTLLSTTNLSSTTTTVSSISQSYTNLLVLVQNPYLSAVQELAIRPNAVADCAFGWRWYIGAASIAATTHLRSEINLGTTTSAANVGYSLLINNYADTTYGKTFYMTGNAASTNTSVIKSGIINTASAITSIDFTTNTGVPTFSGGRVLIYGVK